jgi:hypothetical protein
MNFVAVGPAGPGDFRAFPWAASPTEPLASVINYSSLPGLNIANGLAQPVCNAATTTCSFDLIVKADVAQSHLIVDVVGYYAAPQRTALACQTLVTNGTIPANAFFSVDSPVCPAGTSLTGGGIDTNFSTAEIWVYASKPNVSSTAWTCTARSLFAGDWPFECFARCCSTPGN